MKSIEKLITFTFFTVLLSCAGPEKKTEFFDNGQIASEYYIIKQGDDYLKEGTYKAWHENGRLKLHENYKQGKLEGKSELYSEAGKLKRVFNYKDDLLDGKQENFDAGITIKELYYDKGTPTGIWLYRNPKGETIWSRDMQNPEVKQVSYQHKKSGTLLTLSKEGKFIFKHKKNIGYAIVNHVDKGHFNIVKGVLLLDEANFFYRIKLMSDDKLELVHPINKKEMIFLKKDEVM